MTDRTTEALLRRLELAEKATPGPWGDSGWIWGRVVDAKGEDVAATTIPSPDGPLRFNNDICNITYIIRQSPDVTIADIEEILRLRAEVERLEKEADWLIETKIVDDWNGRFVGAPNQDNSGAVVYSTKVEAVASWREHARKVVEGGMPIPHYIDFDDAVRVAKSKMICGMNEDWVEALSRWLPELKRLREAHAQLEKEAGWLALVLANAACGVPLTEYIDEDANGMSPPAPEHWREAARKACGESMNGGEG